MGGLAKFNRAIYTVVSLNSYTYYIPEYPCLPLSFKSVKK